MISKYFSLSSCDTFLFFKSLTKPFIDAIGVLNSWEKLEIKSGEKSVEVG